VKTLTTTIKRRWLDEIVAGTKKVEYREIKPYWTERLAKCEIPFRLRLINGMAKNAPEVTVLIDEVSVGEQPQGHGAEQFGEVYMLRIGKVVEHTRRSGVDPVGTD
jgi:hypothetical protein